MKTQTQKIVLMVENNMDHIELAHDAFFESGMEFSLKVLQSGNEILDYLSEEERTGEPEKKVFSKPYVILFDIKSLGWQKKAWLHQLQAQNKDPHIPLVLLSSWENPHDKQLTRDVGADDFMVKPLEPVHLEAQFKKLGLI
jgi:DNA-binding response OmpR family regulator